MRIASKITLLTLGSVLLTVVLLCSYFAYELRQALVQGELRNQQSQLALRAQSFRYDVEWLRADAQLLAESPLIRRWFPLQSDSVDDASSLEYRQLVEQSFQALLTRHPEYYQVRVLSLQGQELIRVERIDGKIVIQNASALQDKSNRDYFLKALSLPKGSVYLSDINLNQEFGRIATPELTTIRATSPIYDLADQPSGFVVINKDIGGFVANIVNADAIGDVYIVDAEGYFISHPNKEYTFGAQRGAGHTISLFWPNIAGNVDLSPQAQSRKIQSLIYDDFVVNARRVIYDAGDRRSVITIVQMTPSSFFLQQVTDSFKRQFFGAAVIVLVCVVVAGLFSRLISRRVLIIRALSEYVAEGGRDISLPEKKRDEVDDVVKAFRIMVQHVVDREARLRAHSHKNNEIMNTVLNGVITSTAEGVIEEVNHFAAELFESSRQEMLGKHVSSYLKANGEGAEHAFQFCYSQNSNPYRCTKVQGVRAQGSFSVQLSVGKFTLEGNDYYVAAVEDIGEREKIQQSLDLYAKKLESSNQELQSFAYVASHDLQEPVRKIQSFGELLEREEKENLTESGRLYLDRMISGANRMRTLISSLLELSRIGRTEVDREWVELGDVCKDVIEDLCDQIAAKRVNVRVGTLPNVYGVSTQVRSLMLNLIGNAIKYSSEDVESTVEIGECTPSDASVASHPELADLPVVFYVQDNGIGIPADCREKIFIAFERLHGKSQYPGTGIGLAICKKIVEGMEGVIFVESATPRGSTFVVALPQMVDST